MKYKNVTISGLPGAGSTTLGKQLAEELGWSYFSGGDFLRAFAIREGLFDAKSKLHHDQSIMSDDADRMVDFMMRERAQEEERNIMDSWLSGFMTQRVSGVLKVLVHCSDDAVRIDRIMNRDGVSVHEAKEHIFDRERKNLEKWRRMYKAEWDSWVVDTKTVGSEEEIDFWDPRLYDVVIDTFSNSAEQTLHTVMEALGNSEGNQT